jgi:protein transport protein SEC31
VRALDINPFQSNLLVSGSSDSEIFIWDLNNPTQHLTPGPKTQPPHDVAAVAWNRNVQHILGTTSPDGRTIVWDLR